MKTGSLIVIGLFVFIGLSILFWAIGVSNTYNEKLVFGKAVQSETEITFDKTWKVVADQAQNLENYKEDFREIYIELMDSRYRNDAGAGQQTYMKWIQENHPQFDANLYGTLMNSIEGNREEFLMQQRKLIDVDKELKRMKVRFPTNLITKNKPDLDIKLVTSTVTKQSFETGVDDRSLLKREVK